jgi:flavin reductase (DIM6/NTAB) family NADH-FMN oxidoreductase RutF
MNETSAADYRHAMRNFATGVPIIACGRGEARAGCVATALASLSLSPPSLLVNLALSGSTWAQVRDCGRFSVNFLAARHEALARRFAGGAQGAARFEEGDWREGAYAPVLADALASLECEVEEILERHTHAIIIGRVEAATHREGSPLLHFGGRFLAG